MEQPQQPSPPRHVYHPNWVHQIFRSKAAQTGGVVRRAVRDVEREIGRHAFLAEVKRRGFHVMECGGQFVVICRTTPLTVHF